MTHRCKNMWCKCTVPDDRDYCSTHCRKVKASAQIQYCACNHEGCYECISGDSKVKTSLTTSS